jgi:hypothetical protein
MTINFQIKFNSNEEKSLYQKLETIAKERKTSVKNIFLEAFEAYVSSPKEEHTPNNKILEILNRLVKVEEKVQVPQLEGRVNLIEKILEDFQKKSVSSVKQLPLLENPLPEKEIEDYDNLSCIELANLIRELNKDGLSFKELFGKANAHYKNKGLNKENKTDLIKAVKFLQKK